MLYHCAETADRVQIDLFGEPLGLGMMISVCMATYNGERYLKDQLKSILKQIGPADELVVSDDNSRDGTIGICESFHDDRIKVYHHRGNTQRTIGKKSSSMAVSANFENALNQARGDIIMLADQDDIWLDGRVGKMVLGLRNNTLVLCNFSIIDQAGKVVLEAYHGRDPLHDSVIANVLDNHFIGCCMAFRREILDSALPFPRGLVAHDLWLGCIARTRGRIEFLPEVLHQYRRHEGNASAATGKSSFPILFRIAYRVRILRHIVGRRIDRVLRRHS